MTEMLHCLTGGSALTHQLLQIIRVLTQKDFSTGPGIRETGLHSFKLHFGLQEICTHKAGAPKRSGKANIADTFCKNHTL